MAAFLVWASPSFGADALPGPAPIPLANGAFFALSVPDIKASGAWYREKFGLKVTLDLPRSGPADILVLEGGGLIVELIQHDEALAPLAVNPPVKEAHLMHGFFKSGFIVEDFQSALATLKSRGVKIAYGPYAAKDGRRANVIIQDNAGNEIHIFGK